MMKTKTLYTCEICHTDYSDKNKAKDCEKHHKKEVAIVDKRYLPYTTNGDYPVSIQVKFEDGKIIQYKR